MMDAGEGSPSETQPAPARTVGKRSNVDDVVAGVSCASPLASNSQEEIRAVAGSRQRVEGLPDGQKIKITDGALGEVS